MLKSMKETIYHMLPRWKYSQVFTYTRTSHEPWHVMEK